MPNLFTPPGQASALIEKDCNVRHYSGTLRTFGSLQELQEFHIQHTKQSDAPIVFMNPFHTIRERGGVAHGSEPILAILADTIVDYTRETLSSILANEPISLKSTFTPILTDNEAIERINTIKDEEIKGGNICQMVFSRSLIAQLALCTPEHIESLYRELLKQRGQYMTFLFSDGRENIFLSATPEKHLSVTGTRVEMNPIAGTLRKMDPADTRIFHDRLSDFLNDPKESRELAQVLDEELKMMERICEGGGEITGPFLKQNGAVIHTEYLLSGEKKRNTHPIKLLQNTLHAPTLVGSPLISASKIIAKYEDTHSSDSSRGYYGGEIGILESNGDLDTAIAIRMTHIVDRTQVIIRSGAGITHSSIAEKELVEMNMKAQGIMNILLGKTNPYQDVEDEFKHEKIQALLKQRNEGLSRFHTIKQEDKYHEILRGKSVTILNNGDDFTSMLARMMQTMGMKTNIIFTRDFNPSSDTSDIVLIGPGPGNINDQDDIDMQKLSGVTKELLNSKRNILGICLGHQSIAQSLGKKVERLTEPKQGLQTEITIDGHKMKVGSYNSFAVISPDTNHSDIFQNGNIGSFQFHPESVMSTDGYDILKNELVRILVADREAKKS